MTAYRPCEACGHENLDRDQWAGYVPSRNQVLCWACVAAGECSGATAQIGDNP